MKACRADCTVRSEASRFRFPLRRRVAAVDLPGGEGSTPVLRFRALTDSRQIGEPCS